MFLFTENVFTITIGITEKMDPKISDITDVYTGYQYHCTFTNLVSKIVSRASLTIRLSRIGRLQPQAISWAAVRFVVHFA